MNLNTTQIYATQPQTPPPPAMPITVVKPVSYEFRVAEFYQVDPITNEDKIIKVGLQVQVWEHDQIGNGMVKQVWTDVPRTKILMPPSDKLSP